MPKKNNPAASAEATAPKPAKVAKPRPTAAERKAAEAARKAEYDAEVEARRLAFEAIRPAVWYELFAKVLRLYILSDAYSEVYREQAWWFNAFTVDVRLQTFKTEDAFSQVSMESLSEHQVARLHNGLDTAFGWFEAYDVEQERKRREAEELAERRRAARAKLTDQEAKDLGVR